MTSVLIVDDHALVRDGLKELLKTIKDTEAVGEAGNGLEAIDKVMNLEPDLVLLDISMPTMRGMEAISEIKRLSPGTQILIISMHNTREYIRECFKNGASGYLLKDAASNELRDAMDFDAARRLLYEVLVEGSDEQVTVAKNILAQLDED